MADTTIKQQADEFLSKLQCHSQGQFPPTQMPAQHKQAAELLLSAYAGGGNSELSALTQYFAHSQTATDKDMKNLELCIALDEMHHLQVIGEMIVSLGGDLRFWSTNHAYWTGGHVEYGMTDVEKVSLDIFSEKEAIAGYEALLREMQYLGKDGNPSINQVSTVIRRIIEDENVHLTQFTNKYNQLSGAQ